MQPAVVMGTVNDYYYYHNVCKNIADIHIKIKSNLLRKGLRTFVLKL